MKFVCPVCGYVYEGDSVPEGFKCPLCGADGSKFIKQDEGMTWASERVIPRSVSTGRRQLTKRLSTPPSSPSSSARS